MTKYDGPCWANINIIDVASPLAVINIGHTWMRDLDDVMAPVYADPRDTRIAGECSPERPLDTRCRECDCHTNVRYSKDRMIVYVVIGHQDGCPHMNRRIRGVDEAVAKLGVSANRKRDGLDIK